MSKQAQGRAVPDQTQADETTLHVASGEDATEARQRADQLTEILDRADSRDQAAERRDRAAEGRDTMNPGSASIDRDWSGRDRDAAAGDRADLIENLQPHEAETHDGSPGPDL